jgi:hypothetical protein
MHATEIFMLLNLRQMHAETQWFVTILQENVQCTPMEKSDPQYSTKTCRD